MAVYHDGVFEVFNGNQGDWSEWTGSTEFKAMLLKTAYVQSQTHDFRDDIDASDIVATSYTAGGNALANMTITAITSPTDATKFDADNLTFTAIGSSGGGVNDTTDACAIYKDQASAATSPLIVYVPFGSDTTTNGGDVTINWNANGIFYLDATP